MFRKHVIISLIMAINVAAWSNVLAQEPMGADSAVVESELADGAGRDGRLGLTAKVSTLGYGLDMTMNLGKYTNLRAGANYLDYQYTEKEGGVEYEVDFGFRSGALLFDWHPTGGGFRVSLGAVYNGNHVDMKATPKVTYLVGDTTYDAGDIGNVTGTVDWKPVSPFASIGWGNAVGANGNWHLMIELGVMHLGNPSVKLYANGPIASLPTVQENLRIEEKKAEDDLSRFRWYPVVGIGLSYKF